MKRFLFFLAVAFLTCPLPGLSAGAEVGNDNPTGVTGDYNGNITTAGSYDPYTGNGKRFITDLTVTGSLGTYPLKWTRVNNTRGGQGGAFGQGGGWRHSYEWGIWIRPPKEYSYHDNQYEGPAGIVSYPDGRTMVLYDWYSTLSPAGGEPGDLLVEAGDGNYDLVMADGGRVKFRHPVGSTSGSDLVATEIVDPFGQTTRLERDSEKRLSKIIEPGGRYLQINYRSYFFNVTYPRAETRRVDVIDNVQSFAGSAGQLIEMVSYRYQEERVGQLWYYNLQHVDYADNTHAFYEYLPSDGYTMVSGRIWKCHDVRYAGAMSEIEYEYATHHDTSEPVAIGQVKGEKRPGESIYVSEVIYPQGPFNNTNGGTQADPRKFLRTEKRADGRTRTFQYSSDGGGELKTYTDFKDDLPVKNTTQIEYFWVDSFTYGKNVIDARTKTTSFVKDAAVGAVLSVTYPGPGNPTVRYTYSEGTNKYYLASREDERGKKTRYTRYDANHPNRHMVERINYPDDDHPDAIWESFIYNRFNQVLEHRMTNGFIEKFTYDERGLKQTYTPPRTESDHEPWRNPTRYFYYDGTEDGGLRPDRMDRLKSIIDPRGHTTTYDYNKRGQVIRVTHPATPAHGITFTQSFYNPDGTLAWTADENHPDASRPGHEHERTRYQYDDYKRVISVTKAFEMPATNSYDPRNGKGPLSHTTSSIYLATSPAGRQTEYDCDENFRRKRTTVAPGTGQDEATTTLTYDPVGNLESITDPNGQLTGKKTTYEYDDRNRKKSVTDPLDHKTEWEYDEAGNVKKETRADTYFIQFVKYDAMNRLRKQIDERNYPSFRDYDFAGNLKSQTDENGQTYSYEYDELNRKKQMTYPRDNEGERRIERWIYDKAGNLKTFINRGGAVQTFTYDGRNRQTRFEWNDGTTWQDTAYDPASRVTWITNDASSIHQTYYDDNRLKTEEGWTTAFNNTATRIVTYTYDDDGNRRTVQYQGGDLFIYEYTVRNQLKALWAAGQGQPVINYEYDPSGNLKKATRDNNGTETQLAPDEVNRVTAMAHYFVTGGGRRFDYAYNSVNNVTAVQRDGAQGDGFDYDESRQIKGFKRNATFAWPPPPFNGMENPSNNMSIEFDGCGNRKTVTNSNPTLTDITYEVNDLNQYSIVSESGGASPTPTPTPGPMPTPTPTPTVPPVTPTPTPIPTPPLPTPPPVIPTPTPTPALFQVAEPTFNPPGGEFENNHPRQVTISTTTADARICYTTNGAEPTSNCANPINGSSGSVSITPVAGNGRTLKAIAFKSGWTDSPTHAETYYYGEAAPSPSPSPTAPPEPSPTPTLPPLSSPTPTPSATPTATPTATPQQQVATPTFDPPGGSGPNQSRTVRISTTTPGAHIRYTTDGTTPTSDPPHGEFASPGQSVSVWATPDGTTVLAIACQPGWTDSVVNGATFFYIPPDGSGGEPQLPPDEEETNGQPKYDANGNLIRYKDRIYTYDAQNRLRLVHNKTNNELIATFYYDGKNRQIARNLNGEIRFSVWDGWELIEEWSNAATRPTAYLQGANGVIKSWGTNGTFYFYQDKIGSTTHIADANGNLLESFHYDLYGKPDETSAHGVVDLYAGERWIPELALYDLRNRFMSPELGRFLQADPIGFKGDASNLYRYCGNDSVNRTDPDGLISIDPTWSRLMYWQGHSPYSFNEIADAYRRWQPPGMGDNGGGGGGGGTQLPGDKSGLFEAIRRYGKARGQEIPGKEVVDTGVRDGREAERLVRGDLRRNQRTKRKYGVERGFSEFVNGKRLERGGPAIGPDNEYEPTVALPTRPDSGAKLGPRFMGIHAHGPQSGRSFDYKDIPLGEGKFGNTPYISVVTSTLDKGKDVHFNVPPYGTWSTSDGGATFRAGD